MTLGVVVFSVRVGTNGVLIETAFALSPFFVGRVR